MKLAIVGSRTFNDYGKLSKFIYENFDVNQITHIISGGARGADSLGEKFAEEHNKYLVVFPAEWEKYGIRAGFKRNIDIINGCDKCVAFWDGKSRGTKNDIDLCKKNGKECKVCLF